MAETANIRSATNAEEQRLLEAVAGGDRGAFGDLFRNYHPRLFKFIFRLTHSYSTSDELVNDIMLVVWRQAASFRGASRVSTWIFGIAYRQCMKRLARDKKRSFRSDVDPDGLAATTGNLEDEDWVRRGLQQLPDAQHITALLVFYLGLSYEEVAEVSDCPVGTVKTRMFHARRNLRDLMPGLATPTAGISAGEQE